MSEPMADSQPHAAFVFNHEGEQYVMRKDYERLRAMLSWIPVSERLPESGDMVLVWDYGEHLMAWLNFTSNGTAYFSAPGRSNFEVTHWMPLPVPPR